MNPRRILLTSALAMLLAQTAHAELFFDSVTGQTTQGADGYGDGVLWAADSFTAPNAGTFVVQLLLSAGTPSDGGSFGVYLVPDDGTGAGTGAAGAPNANFVNGNYSDSQLIATVADSSLSATESLTTLAVTSSITTSNNEYWIGLVTNAGSSVEWSWNNASGFPGSANQNVAYDIGAGAVVGGDDASGPYALSVQAPEPAALALLGSGLFGLGFFRRRRVG
jgi:hypothetical protein